MNKMRRMKIDPVNLVNPVYFLRAFMSRGDALKQ